ncbi:hypothetical protein [Streptomyces sp. I6]|uniref:hypothetical protein n=1 Tax=Streptomyces sp. I6 TaxID=2483113 RepID=UPI000F44ADE7|nr:hypothetical protein [Streptomyces sp. I6]RNL68247.1 hypothetical protein EBF04_30050 [Streptomyces sp. I6]
MSAVAGESIAAGVGTGIGHRRFHAVAAWAWVWRSFETALPDVGGAAWQTDPVAPGRAERHDERPGQPSPRDATEPGGNAHFAYGGPR